MIEDASKSRHKFNGMRRGLHPIDQPVDKLWDAHNIRLTNRGGESYASITNEKSTSQMLTFNVSELETIYAEYTVTWSITLNTSADYDGSSEEGSWGAYINVGGVKAASLYTTTESATASDSGSLLCSDYSYNDVPYWSSSSVAAFAVYRYWYTENSSTSYTVNAVSYPTLTITLTYNDGSVYVVTCTADFSVCIGTTYTIDSDWSLNNEVNWDFSYSGSTGDYITNIAVVVDYELLEEEEEVIEYGTLTIYKYSSDGDSLTGAVFRYSGTASGTIRQTTNPVSVSLVVGSYTVRETSAPSGYTVATAAQTAKITSGGTVTLNFFDDVEEIEETVSYYDVHIRKLDEEGNYLAGCELSLYNSSGELISSWTSGDTYETLSLVADSYTITETAAASGYDIAEDETFIVDSDGNAWQDGAVNDNYVDMINTESEEETFAVTVNKTDESGDYLSGCSLELYDADGTLISSWTSTSSYKTLSLAAGTYTLKEVAAASDYTLADDVTFTVSDAMSVTMANSLETFDCDIYISIQYTSGDTPVSGDTSYANVEVYNASTSKSTTYSASWAFVGTAGDSETSVYKGTLNDVRITGVTPSYSSYYYEEDGSMTGYFTETAVLTLTYSDGSTYTETTTSVSYNSDSANTTTSGTESSYPVVSISYVVTLDYVEIEETTGVLRIYKYSSDGDSLTGATFSVEDEQSSGITVSQTTNPVSVTLDAGTYTVTETSAPSGYTVATDAQTITITGGETTDVTFYDDEATYTVKINKYVADTTTFLQGAQLSVYDEEGNAVTTFTTSATSKSLTLSAGTYTLEEITTPDGFYTAETVTFTVSSNTSVTMYDEAMYPVEVTLILSEWDIDLDLSETVDVELYLYLSDGSTVPASEYIMLEYGEINVPETVTCTEYPSTNVIGFGVAVNAALSGTSSSTQDVIYPLTITYKYYAEEAWHQGTVQYSSYESDQLYDVVTSAGSNVHMFYITAEITSITRKTVSAS